MSTGVNLDENTPSQTFKPTHTNEETPLCIRLFKWLLTPTDQSLFTGLRKSSLKTNSDAAEFQLNEETHEELGRCGHSSVHVTVRMVAT